MDSIINYSYFLIYKGKNNKGKNEEEILHCVACGKKIRSEAHLSLRDVMLCEDCYENKNARATENAKAVNSLEMSEAISFATHDDGEDFLKSLTR